MAATVATVTASTQVGTMPVMETFRPAGGVLDDLEAWGRGVATEVGDRAAARLGQVVTATVSQPAFGENVGRGLVTELRRPESAAILTQLGDATGQSVAKSLMPMMLLAFVVGAAAGGAVVLAVTRR